jgi:hypothetical protein
MRIRIIQLFVIVFSLSALAPNMQGLQLFRINNLLHHIQHHYGADWTWSEMKSFVSEHYTSTQLPADKEHDTLPFKSVVHSAAAPVIAEVPVINLRIDKQHLAEETERPAFPLFVAPTMERSGNIWTPPQLS